MFRDKGQMETLMRDGEWMCLKEHADPMQGRWLIKTYDLRLCLFNGGPVGWAATNLSFASL
ncbi:hypothetical protein SAMN05421823_11544 [Catalinimonas alkaloidigena]|uniref:Uncharacterized protein n=1 Tax=Catalinimonas alkaloidigena TaxID=1075417 RepID=A0A1G9U077_9BACT|nr:hypothetical protein SAMN05421823_11544 [Catalinimonas alkaloidigena]